MRGFFTIVLTLAVGYVAGQSLVPASCSNCGYSNYFKFEPNMDSGPTKKAVIFYLHGDGGLGGNGDVLREGLPYAMSEYQVLNAYSDDFFVFVPHDYTSAAEWDATKVRDFIDKMLAEHAPDIDLNRIILTGFSRGGKGVFNFLGEGYSDILAGAMPIMGGLLNTLDVCNLAEYPVWAFGSEFDRYFPPKGTSTSHRDGVSLVRDKLAICGVPFDYQLTILESKDHHGWDEIYNLRAGYPIYEWMKQVDKSNSDNYHPLVMLESDKTILNNNERWIIHAYLGDIEDERSDLNLTWDVINNSTLLSAPNFIVSDEGLIILSSPQVGSYTVSVTVTDSNGDSSSDSMVLTVIDADDVTYPYVTDFTLLYPTNIPSPTERPLEDNDIIETDQLTTEERRQADIRLTLNQPSPNTRISFGLSENREFTSGTSSSGTYKIVGLSGLTGINVYFRLPDEEAPRLYTMTATTIRPDGTNGISSQVNIHITQDPAVLPVTLLSFNGKADDQGVRLDWSTTDEKDNSHFEIFRGRTDSDLFKVGEVPRAEPGKEFNYYSFTDRETTTGGIYYYRLESVDFDGHRDISDIIRVALPGRLEVYPNPAVQGRFYINLPKEGNPAFQLVNSKGQPVRYSVNASPSGPGEKEIVIHAPLPGIYLLQAFHEGRYQSFKVVIPD